MFLPAILAAVDPRDSAAELEKTIERYNQAWNDHDLDAIIKRTIDYAHEVGPATLLGAPA